MRAGVVGTGFIGVVHVEALRRLGIEVAGVVGSSPERARAKPGLPEPYESFEALLADDSVDVVHITTPNHLHYPQVEGGARGGQARRLREAARADLEEAAELCGWPSESGLVHCTNYNIRFYGQCRAARDRIARRASSGASSTSTAATSRTGC